MRRFVPFALLALLLAAAIGGAAYAGRDSVTRFATLPAGQPGHPEGIAADPRGNIYAASFDFSGNNNIYVFGADGALADTIALSGHVPLGMQWGPDGRLYVADFGTGAVLQVQVASHKVRSFPICTGAGSTCALNAIAFDGAGTLYVSDSFGGRIFTLDTKTGVSAQYFQSGSLVPGSHGFPPFGANGIAFDASGNLYIANTADDRVFKLSPAKQLSTFTESINGADGINFDSLGRLWVCANQENTLYLLDANGRVVDIRGTYEGPDTDGAPRGLLFPASIVFSGSNAYVTNSALDFRHFFADEPAGGFTRFTISRVPVGPTQ